MIEPKILDSRSGSSMSDSYSDVTIQTCWDADRLDLGRVGITPKSLYLGSNLAKDQNFIEMAYMRSKKRFVDE